MTGIQTDGSVNGASSQPESPIPRKAQAMATPAAAQSRPLRRSRHLLSSMLGCQECGTRKRWPLNRLTSVYLEPQRALLDEPCSALDPIATARIEELLQDLKSQYTLVIVTHNMQQASRVSDYTAFLYLGELIEYGLTEKIFINPLKKQTEDYITGRFG